MQPRVFVSSTYYDLKYVRDRIELFLKRFSFEPVLFESDKVTFEHNKPLDSSCYEEVKLCHMFILIVGGRYGSPSTGHKQEEFQKRYEDEYVSITRKEYETAIKSEMPCFIFIDKSVYSEYQTFKKNQTFFEQLIRDKKIETKEFSFAHVDNQNIFYFIDILQQKAIKQFDNVDEIENYLSSQFSGMFFLYLKQLQEKASNTKILDTISELNSVVSKMDTMVEGIGKVIIKKPGELEEINRKQFEVLANNFVYRLFENNTVQYIKKNFEPDIQTSQIISEIFFRDLLLLEIPEEYFLLYRPRRRSPVAIRITEQDRAKYKQDIITKINLDLTENNYDLQFEDIDVWKIYRLFIKNVKPFINTNPENIEILKRELANLLYFTLA